MGKRKDWIYAEANGCIVGLMKCQNCGKKIVSGVFRYYETEHAYVLQCKSCGGNDKSWVAEDQKIALIAQKQWEEDARTDHVVLLQRIKEAFYEGYSEGNFDFHCIDLEEAWNCSEAKRIHDVLEKLWSVQ